MEFDAVARACGWMFNWMLGGYYKRYLPERDWRTIKRTTSSEYRAMVTRTPGIGGGSLQSNLLMGCYFFSLPKADPQMTPELMDKMFDYGFSLPIMVKLHAGAKRKGELFTDEHQDKRVAEAAASRDSDYELDWRYTYVKGKDEFWCTYTECGLVKLARRESMEAYMPCLCRSDYANYRLQGAKLERTKTLGSGGDCCDFHVVRVKS